MALCFVQGSTLLASPLRLPGEDGPGYVDVEKIRFVVDQGWALTLEDVLELSQSDESWEHASGTLNLGYTDAAVWLDLPIVGSVSSDHSRWLMELAYPNLDRVDLWVVRGGRVESFYETGDSRIFSSRPIHHRNFLFPLTMRDAEPTRVIVRLGTTSSLQVPLRLWRASVFSREDQSNRLMHGMFFGVMLVMAIYNFFIFVSIRERSYLHYVAFVCAAAVYQGFHHGFTFQHLWPEQIWWHARSGAVAICLTIVFAALFSRSVLELPARLPKASRILVVLAALAGMLSLVSFLISYSWVARGAAILAIPTALTIIFSGLFLWNQAFAPARTFVMAWVSFIVGALAFAGNKLGVLPHNVFTENGLQIGSTLEVMLLSFSLGQRINQERRERLEAKEHMLSEQLLLTKAYERFVPERFLALLGKDSIRDVHLGDHVEMTMSILFADIRGFTTISEDMTPKENFEFLNRYLERMQPLVEKHGGFVDKYIGDCIMALFDRSPDDAIAAGIGLQASLRDFNEERVKEGRAPFEIGVGVNLGELMLGTIGAEGRLEGTVISDAVNTAARIESLTKTYGAGLIISQSVKREIVNPVRFTIRVLDRVRVKGRSEPVLIYEVLDALPRNVKKRRASYIDTFEVAVDRYWNKEFGRALEGFHACKECDPDDPVVDLFVRRAAWYARQGTGPDWTGAFEIGSQAVEGEPS